MKEKTITALMVAPNMKPCLIVLENNLDFLQKAVSIGAPYQGLIEVHTLEPSVFMICNDEGKLLGLPGNRRLGVDIIAGIFYIVSEDQDGNFASLSPHLAEKYAGIFQYPEEISDAEVLDALFTGFSIITED